MYVFEGQTHVWTDREYINWLRIKKYPVLYIRRQKCGNGASGDAINLLARFAAHCNSYNQILILVDDFTALEELKEVKEVLLMLDIKWDSHLKVLRLGKLELRPSCIAEESLQIHPTKILSDIERVTRYSGYQCMYICCTTYRPCRVERLEINMRQMVACVRKQSVRNRRALDDIAKRSFYNLSFYWKRRAPAANGFFNSFFLQLRNQNFTWVPKPEQKLLLILM